jgi:sec-independent protein translocase protein TatB
MFGVGFQELLIVVVIALIIFGPRRLPQMARDLGHFVSEARRAVDDFREEISAEEVNEDQPNEDQPGVEEPMEEPVEEPKEERASSKE